jgi:hypothetical protein
VLVVKLSYKRVSHMFLSKIHIVSIRIVGEAILPKEKIIAAT